MSLRVRAAIQLHCSIRVTEEVLDHALQFGRTDLWENLKDAASVDQIRSNTLARSMVIAISKGINFFAVLCTSLV